MNTAEPITVLNRLLTIHARSLPMYLRQAAPAALQGTEKLRNAVAAVAREHQRMVDRVGAMIVEWGGPVSWGRFPLRFASWHDVSCVYLLPHLIADQQQRVAAIEECVAELRLAPFAQALAQEALGEARGHLQTLNELAGKPAAVA